MHNTKIGIFKIAQTRVNWLEVLKWLEFIGVQDAVKVIAKVGSPSLLDCSDNDLTTSTVVTENGVSRCVTPGTDASALIALAGKRCYMSFDTESGLNPNVTKIREDHAEYVMNILKSGHGCYDIETDVLTSEGWVNWTNVTAGMELATLNADGVVEWHRPIRLIEFEHTGNMVRVDSAQVDLLVTPDHNMLACPTTTKKGRKKAWEDYKLAAAASLVNKSHAYLKGLPAPVDIRGGSPMMELLGFAIGDGSIRPSGPLDFHLRRVRKITYLRDLCARANLVLEEFPDRDIYRVSREQWRDRQEMFDGIYDSDRNKIIPTCVFAETTGNLHSVWTGLINSDGSVSDTGTVYDTTSETLAGQIQHLVMLLGFSANISQAECYKTRENSFGDKPIHRLGFPLRCNKPEVNRWDGCAGKVYTVENWRGTVFCAEVPNNTLYVRRNGKPVWSGNSVLEHATWSFAIENVSRVFTGEMNRHRAGVAISEGSMRYIRFDDIGFTMPSSLEPLLDGGPAEPSGNDEVDHVLKLYTAEQEKRSATREVLKEAFTATEKLYIDLCNIWKIGEMKDFAQKKKLTSMFRRIIGMGVSTGGVWTINARALNWILNIRCSEHAEEEICEVFSRIAEIMIADEPLLFGHFRKNEKGFWESSYPKV
jgi:thymidylate synthase ThyX